MKKFTFEIDDDVYAKLERMARIAGWRAADVSQTIQDICSGAVNDIANDVTGFAMMVEGDSEADAQRIAKELSKLPRHKGSFVTVTFREKRFHYHRGKPASKPHVEWHNSVFDPALDVCAEEVAP